MMRRCIYCRAEKDDRAFSGREHVIPQAFGVFHTTNLVLKCVCDECNTYFGAALDTKLARDSMEAIDRITVGLKQATEFQSLGRRSTSHVEFLEGPVAGGKGYAIANQDGGSSLGVMAFPQVWFAKSEDGPWQRFLLPDVPTKEELLRSGFTRGELLFIKTFEIPDAAALLKSKGFEMEAAQWSPTAQPKGLVHIENVMKVAEPEFRAATKIALNYVAAVLGSAVALESAFDSARDYARYGSERARVRVYAHQNPWFLGRRGHYVCLKRVDDLLVAQLSLLMRTQYFVVLGSDEGASTRFLATAHFFDLETRTWSEIEPLPIRPGRPLWRRHRNATEA